MQGRVKASEKNPKEFPFLLRIINPEKIKHAVFFSADEHVRNAKKVLEEKMPWIVTAVFSDPLSVSNYRPDHASALIFDDTALNIVDTQKIRQNTKDAVLVLLSSNEFIQCSPPSVAQEKQCDLQSCHRKKEKLYLAKQIGDHAPGVACHAGKSKRASATLA